MQVKKRIFLGLCFACFVTLFLTATFMVRVIYTNSNKQVKKEIIHQSKFIGTALTEGANDHYIIVVGKESENRITLIALDGTVLYDNYVPAKELGNHLDRPEIQEAVLKGKGEITRLSTTLGEKSYYYAEKLTDGNILRIGCTIKTSIGLLENTIIWTVLIVVFILILSIVIAVLITKLMILPINKIDLSNPLLSDTYEELSPLLTKMEKQNQKIALQINELTERQQEFDYIVGSMNEGLIIYGEKGIVLSENNSAKSIFGNSIGKTYLQLSRDIDYIKAIESALSGKHASVKLNKNARTYQLSANPVGEKSDTYAAVLFIVDITDKEQAERMRREFSANVSHELKTPLTSIMGYAEIIENGIAKEDDIPQFVHQIHTEAARLLTLIEDILRLSRLDEGNIKQSFEAVELSELCLDVIKELTEKAKTKNVSLNFEGDAATIKGYKTVLYEMVFNLCDNAINYNIENGSVTVKLLKNNNRIQLSVTDTGIGIAPEYQERIFERFYRVDKSHSKETGGTGLGLSIVKHAAAIHEAEISLDSKVNYGTTITITIKNHSKII